MAHTKESLRELFKMAEETEKYGAIDAALLRTVKVPWREEVEKERTQEDRERFQRLLNTPYGL